MLRSFVRTASAAADLTGLSRALAIRYAGRGTIFSLHSVVEDDAPYLDTLRYPASKLAWLLRWLSQQGTEFISVDDVEDRLRGSSTRPFAAFTFDDGYADNLTRALPVMEKFGAPFTVYVTTGMVTRTIDAWWFSLASLIRSRAEIEFPGLGHFACRDFATRKQAFAAIEFAIHQDYRLLDTLRGLIERNAIDCRASVDQEALTEDQLRKLSRHPLVTIGAHTVSHCNLAQASTAQVHWEMTTSREYLEELTGKPVEHFAYPFGNPAAIGTRELEISREAGFRSAVTTRHGAVFSDHLLHLHALPRVSIHAHDTPSSLRCKFHGFYRAFHSRLGDPVVRI